MHVLRMHSVMKGRCVGRLDAATCGAIRIRDYTADINDGTDLERDFFFIQWLCSNCAHRRAHCDILHDLCRDRSHAPSIPRRQWKSCHQDCHAPLGEDPLGSEISSHRLALHGGELAVTPTFVMDGKVVSQGSVDRIDMQMNLRSSEIAKEGVISIEGEVDVSQNSIHVSSVSYTHLTLPTICSV